MKVAIMTQPLGKNYGGIMQAWALQKVLKEMGHEPVTVDRQLEPPSIAYKTARLIYRAGMKVIGKRKGLISYEQHMPNILQHTQSFIDQHIIMSEPLYNTPQLRDHFDREKYCAVIVGSDQTWRPKYSPNIENFFLDFLENVNIKRLSYASSFGVDNWEFSEKQTKRCAQLIRYFDAVSVRESSAVELCKNYLGITAEHVLDPTLMLSKASYIKLIGDERIKANPQGVFTYFLDKTPEKQAMASMAAAQLDDTVYSRQAKCSLASDIACTLDDYRMPDVRDWLAGFVNAKYVLTDSFHGVVFSILFNKPFLAIGNHERGLSRFSSLLEIVGLSKCLVFVGNEDKSSSANIDINWNHVNSLLFSFREQSFEFLNESLSADYLAEQK